jgi:hypothetical protein
MMMQGLPAHVAAASEGATSSGGAGEAAASCDAASSANVQPAGNGSN